MLENLSGIGQDPGPENKLNPDNPLVKKLQLNGRENFAVLTNQGIINLLGGGQEFAKWHDSIKDELTSYLDVGGELPLPPEVTQKMDGTKLKVATSANGGIEYYISGYAADNSDLLEALGNIGYKPEEGEELSEAA